MMWCEIHNKAEKIREASEAILKAAKDEGSAHDAAERLVMLAAAANKGIGELAELVAWIAAKCAEGGR